MESVGKSVNKIFSILEVALYTEPEEIYLVMKDGNLNMYDATNKEMRVKITNPLLKGSNRGVRFYLAESLILLLEHK